MSNVRKLSPLRQLAIILNDAVDQIEGTFDKAGISYPSVDEPMKMDASERLALSPDVVQASFLAVAACDQLSATLRVPTLTLFDYVGGFHISSCIRALVESNVVEILREAGPKGLHCKYISKRNGIEPSKLGRMLRLCSTHHIFREITPDVFTNNRLSSMMDTLKPHSELIKDVENKHSRTPGVAALVEHFDDEVFKGSAIMTDVLRNKARGFSDDPKDSPMMAAFSSTTEPWEWFEAPGNEKRFKRFASAMQGIAKIDPPNAILMGFDWSSLPKHSVIVDVGGGVGTLALKIAQSQAAKKQRLKFVVQDRVSVIREATEFWRSNMPEALCTGLVRLQAHDFFAPQPLKHATVFLLRMILHDWGRANAISILKNLRSAATKGKTKLLIVDQIVPYSCREEVSTISTDIPGAKQPLPPAPLLANLGKANAIAYISDLQMYVALNGEERTLGSFLDIFEESGWKLHEIFTIPGSMHKQLLAVPA